MYNNQRNPVTTSNFAEEQETLDILANLLQVQSGTYFGPVNLEAQWIVDSGASISQEVSTTSNGGCIGG